MGELPGEIKKGITKDIPSFEGMKETKKALVWRKQCGG